MNTNTKFIINQDYNFLYYNHNGCTPKQKTLRILARTALYVRYTINFDTRCDEALTLIRYDEYKNEYIDTAPKRPFGKLVVKSVN
jgi:hypothetical protein